MREKRERLFDSGIPCWAASSLMVVYKVRIIIEDVVGFSGYGNVIPFTTTKHDKFDKRCPADFLRIEWISTCLQKSLHRRKGRSIDSYLLLRLKQFPFVNLLASLR